MKISHRLALIVLFATIGFILLSAYSLYVVRDAMLSERKAGIETHVRMAGNLIAQFQAAEKSGKLSREDAQRLAAQAIRGMRHKGDYMVLRDFSGLFIAHPDKRKEGKIDPGGKLPDGRTTIEGYREVLEKSDFGYVLFYTRRPDGDVQYPRLNGVLKIPEWNWILGTGVFLDDIDAIFWQRVWQFLGIGAAVFACMDGIAIWISHAIYRALGGEPSHATRVAQAIASGQLNQRIDDRVNDASLLGAMARMQEHLRGMVLQIQQNANQLNQSAHGINQQMMDMASMASHATDAATSSTAAIQQLSHSVQNISGNAQRTQTQSARAATLAEDGGVLVSDAASHIQQVSEQLAHASEQIAALDQRAAEIGGIAGVIKDIADQTNLLALNAAIEAARAGEQGRGFAVVADEVRKLAERTTQATAQIASMIGAVQRDTRDVVGSMSAAAPQVESSVDKAQSAARALGEIRAGAALALDNIRDVASATLEQSVANQSVAEHIERIASMVAQSARTAEQARHSAQQLEVLADQLNAAVAKFQV